MRHRKAGIKLNRTTSHRNAMFRNMVTSLFKYDRIKTTDVKAKELRRWADNLITLAKRGDLHARRQALSIMMEKDVVHKLFDEAGERFGNINGGYTRIVKLGKRPGDAASISLIELVSGEKKKTKKKEKPVAAQPVQKEDTVEADKTEEAVEVVDAKKAETVESEDPISEASESGDEIAPESETKEEIKSDKEES